MTRPDRRTVLAALAALVPGVAAAQIRSTTPESELDPTAQFLWTARLVIVFAPSENDPRFRRQIREIESVSAQLEERDAVVLTDTEPGASRFETTPLRAKYRPHDFNLLIVGKDGQVKLRRPGPVDGQQIVRLIDRLPLRQQETGRR